MNHPILSILAEARHPMRIDLIGVAGSGMSGLASLLLALGHRVSGSDRVTTLETQRLAKAGLQFFSPHCDREVEGCDMVIYSSAIKPGNIAYEAAYKQGIPLVRRAEALAAVMLNKKGVLVAGTHGKPTTLVEAVMAVFTSKKVAGAMQTAAKKLAVRDSALKIAKIVEEA